MALLTTALTLFVAASPDGGVEQIFEESPAVLHAEIEVPGAIDEVALPELQHAVGIPVRIRAVRSKEGVETLRAFYVRYFEKLGLFVPEREVFQVPAHLEHVTAYDVGTQTSHSVLFQRNLDGTTTVVVGTALLHAKQEVRAEDEAPVFPGAVDAVVSTEESGSALRFTARATREEVHSFYRQVFTEVGYAETEPGRFERQGAGARVWIKERAPGVQSVVVLTTRGLLPERER